jgi:hypothetical protein
MSLSLNGRAQVLVKHVAEQQQYQQSFSPEDKTQMLENNDEAEKKNVSLLPLMTKVKF